MNYYYYKLDHPFFIVHAAMTFQFKSPYRHAHIKWVKQALGTTGLFILQEKVWTSPEIYASNEEKKNREYKARYFSFEEIERKRKEILESGHGMERNMVDDYELENILGMYFAYVVQFWDAGNFKGYAMSNVDTGRDFLLRGGEKCVQ